MRKRALALSVLALAACSKHDPILPGTRTAIFDMDGINVLNQPVENLPADYVAPAPIDCPYTQDASNTVWDGTRKIFSGFPTSNSVDSNQQPVCSGKYVYAGLSTGELVKINPATRQIVWIADIYRPSNMTGGATILDIIAPIVVNDGDVYAGGLGDAFCKINATTGDKKWCTEIGVATPFIIVGDVAYVVATDANLYALRTSDGAAYWRTSVGAQDAPKFENGIVRVANKKINATTGDIVK